MLRHAGFDGAGPRGIHADVARQTVAVCLLFFGFIAKSRWCLLTYRYNTYYISAWQVIASGGPVLKQLAQALMVALHIGIKVATLPVIALGVGIGVDYALYVLGIVIKQLRPG